MTDRVDVFYGGCYREEWDENYRLTIEYVNREHLTMLLRDGQWFSESKYPDLPLAEYFFPQAASATVAAQSFVASGLTVTEYAAIRSNYVEKAFFCAELMRILMDDYGLPMELIYPYIPELPEEDYSKACDHLFKLQPRTAHVLKLFLQLLHSVPAVRHDIRLQTFRTPFGALKTEEELKLSLECRHVEKAELELYGDEFFEEYEMGRTDSGFAVTVPGISTPTALWYRFRIETSDSLFWLCAAPDGLHGWLRRDALQGFRLTVYDQSFQTPAWFQNGVMYQIFPDRFAFSNREKMLEGIAYHLRLGQCPELHASLMEEPKSQPRDFEESYSPDDFYGGRLEAIKETLPYLQHLGINCIYLNPIVEARSNHRYDTSDYTHVDPILGSNEDFTSLCSAAETFGIRILCDGVFSHTGADSIYFNRDGHYPGPGACQEEPSPYDSWYDFRHFPDDYRCWWGFRDLPEVEEHDPGWQDYVVTGEHSIVKQWLRLGAAGWRLDVADELPDDVLHLIRKAAKEEKADAVILGEVWEDAVLKESYGNRRKYALGFSLDSVMNYPFRVAVLDFLLERSNAFQLSDFLSSQQLHYPQPLYRSLMNLLGSHDVERLRTALASGMRLKDFTREEQQIIEAGLTEADYLRADRLRRLAFAIQFAVPGVPSIYYGDEQRMTGTNDPFNRKPFVQCSVTEDVDYLASLAALHRKYAEDKVFFAASDQDVLMILRYGRAGNWLTVVNRAEEVRSFHLEYAGLNYQGTVQAQMAKII